MSAIARPRSGGGAAADGFAAGSPAGRDRPPAGAGSRSGSAPRPAVESHHDARRVGRAGCRLGGLGGRVGGSWLGAAAGAGRVGPAPRSAAASSGRVRVRGCARWPRPARPASACLVLRSVLARVGVFLRVERPVRAARRAVPAGAAPVGLERAVDAVVRGRAEGRLLCGRSERRREPPVAPAPLVPARPVPSDRPRPDPRRRRPRWPVPARSSLRPVAPARPVPDVRVRVDRDARPPAAPARPLVVLTRSSRPHPVPAGRPPTPAGPSATRRRRSRLGRRTPAAWHLPGPGRRPTAGAAPAGDGRRPFPATLPSASCS